MYLTLTRPVVATGVGDTYKVECVAEGKIEYIEKSPGEAKTTLADSSSMKNETGWTAVKGSVSGNILTITAQDNTCTDTISWMVVGERQDDNIKSSSLTDANGKLIMEPNQIPSPPPPTI